MSTDPLIVLQLPFVTAIDPQTGALRWSTHVGDAGGHETSPGRLLPTPQGLMVMAGHHIWHLELATGALKGKVTLPFVPDTVIFDGECFYAARVPDIAAVELSGRVRFKAMHDDSGWLANKFVCVDGNGKKLWESAAPPEAIKGVSAGLALGAMVSQPDGKGHS